MDVNSASFFSCVLISSSFSFLYYIFKNIRNVLLNIYIYICFCYYMYIKK